MILKAISVDDEPRAHHVIRYLSSKVEQLELTESFTSPTKAATFLNKNKVDILFLDINMPDMDGLSLLRTLKDPPNVIFTTAYDEYAVESYDFEAAGYLLKPIEFPKFYKSVMRVLDKKAANKPPDEETTSATKTSLLLKSGTKLLRFEPDDIVAIEASGNYAELHINGKKVMIDHTLSELSGTYLPACFLRVHRSYIINLHYLREFESHQLKVDQYTIPIGKTYRQDVKKAIRFM